MNYYEGTTELIHCCVYLGIHLRGEKMEQICCVAAEHRITRTTNEEIRMQEAPNPFTYTNFITAGADELVNLDREELYH